MNLLKIENLCKTYPDFYLDNVSFDIDSGEIMGFIGRNGAGKTTTLKSMLHFVKPDSGKVFINGFDIDTNENDVKKSIGFVCGDECFYRNYKIKKITSVTKKFFPEWNDFLYESYIRKFQIDENKLVKNLSAGMKIKYQIALAMSHDAKLLILDEPTSGLDPVSRDELIMIFEDYVADGKHSILFSTHVISDLEKCADRITYIKNGKIFSSHYKAGFEAQYDYVSGNVSDLTDEMASRIVGLHKKGDTFEGIFASDDIEILSKFNTRAPTLEEIMVHIER